ATRSHVFALNAYASGLLKVAPIYKSGPASKDYVKIQLGNSVLAVDGQALKAGENYWKLYTTAPGSKMEFLVNSKASKEGAWTAKVRPVSGLQYATLQYER